VIADDYITDGKERSLQIGPSPSIEEESLKKLEEKTLGEGEKRGNINVM